MEDTNLLSNHIRKTIFKMINSSGAAHIGSALSMVEILDSIFSTVDIEKIKNKQNDRDRIILSKGHGAAGLYATMFHYGLLTESDISSYFCKLSLSDRLNTICVLSIHCFLNSDTLLDFNSFLNLKK